MAINSLLKIETPRGKVFQYKTSKGTIESQLVWNKDFASKKTESFTKAQMFVDKSVLQLSDPLTPMRTKFLIRSGTLGTVIGSGEVVYLAPYARRMYYNPKYHFQDAPMRGAYWFERMKTQYGKQIMEGVGKIADE